MEIERRRKTNERIVEVVVAVCCGGSSSGSDDDDDDDDDNDVHTHLRPNLYSFSFDVDTPGDGLAKLLSSTSNRERIALLL